MYRLAICDDEQTAREELCRMCGEALTKLDVEHEIVPFSSARALSDALSSRAGAVRSAVPGHLHGRQDRYGPGP